MSEKDSEETKRDSSWYSAVSDEGGLPVPTDRSNASPVPTPCTAFLRSLEGLLQDEYGDTSSPAYMDEEAAVRVEVEDSVTTEWGYWGRLYSALYSDDTAEEPETVEEEWREHARYWRRHGKGTSVIDL